MPNFYEEQARQRFHRAKAFVDKAHGLMLQEDLVSRSALDDAISAIKNSLQGYLMYQIAQSSSSRAQNDWPEVAAGNRMPDLIRACQQAGLPLNGLDSEIKKLNDERNFRTHDDPLRAVDTVQARQAVEVALMVQRRIADALKRSGVSGILTGRPAVSEEATMPKTGAGRAPVAGRAASASPVGGSCAQRYQRDGRAQRTRRQGITDIPLRHPARRAAMWMTRSRQPCARPSNRGRAAARSVFSRESSSRLR